MKFSPEQIESYYRKRWSSLSTKILLIEKRILESTNDNTQSYLREYLQQIINNKQEEKKGIGA